MEDIQSRKSKYLEKVEDSGEKPGSKGGTPKNAGSPATGRWSPSMPTCTTCEKNVYPMEQITVDMKPFHKTCFKCEHCNKVLSVGTYAALDGRTYCKPHFKQLFALKGNYNEGFGTEQHKNKWDRTNSVEQLYTKGEQARGTATPPAVVEKPADLPQKLNRESLPPSPTKSLTPQPAKATNASPTRSEDALPTSPGLSAETEPQATTAPTRESSSTTSAASPTSTALLTSATSPTSLASWKDADTSTAVPLTTKVVSPTTGGVATTDSTTTSSSPVEPTDFKDCLPLVEATSPTEHHSPTEHPPPTENPSPTEHPSPTRLCAVDDGFNESAANSDPVAPEQAPAPNSPENAPEADEDTGSANGASQDDKQNE